MIITIKTFKPEEINRELERQKEKVNREKNMNSRMSFRRNHDVFEICFTYDFEGRWTNPKIMKACREKILLIDPNAVVKHSNEKVNHFNM